MYYKLDKIVRDYRKKIQTFYIIKIIQTFVVTYIYLLNACADRTFILDISM